jgi:hypothetical protein
MLRHAHGTHPDLLAESRRSRHVRCPKEDVARPYGRSRVSRRGHTTTVALGWNWRP